VFKHSVVDQNLAPDMGLHWETGPKSGSRKEKSPTKIKKRKKLCVLKCWIFFLRAEDFSCKLEVLYGGLGFHFFDM
jgi:hypothetical protein